MKVREEDAVEGELRRKVHPPASAGAPLTMRMSTVILKPNGQQGTPMVQNFSLRGSQTRPRALSPNSMEQAASEAIEFQVSCARLN